MEILRTQSTLIILSKFDEIPIIKLINPHFQEKLKKRYKFSNVELTPADNRITLGCQLGLFKATKSPIIRLSVEERKIVYDIEGSKEEILKLHRDFVKFLKEIDGQQKEILDIPVLMVEESEIIVKMDFDISSLISEKYYNFLQSEAVLSEVPLQDTTVRIRPTVLKFEVEFINDNFSLHDYRIALSRKEIILQPRSGYPLEDKIFVSKLPVDSATHYKMLIELEKQLIE